MRRSVNSRYVAEPAAVYGSDHGEVVLYRAPDGGVTLDVRLERETLWLNLNQMAGLFGRDKSVISCHLVASLTMGSWSEIRLLHFLQQFTQRAVAK